MLSIQRYFLTLFIIGFYCLPASAHIGFGPHYHWFELPLMAIFVVLLIATFFIKRRRVKALKNISL